MHIRFCFLLELGHVFLSSSFGFRPLNGRDLRFYPTALTRTRNTHVAVLEIEWIYPSHLPKSGNSRVTLIFAFLYITLEAHLENKGLALFASLTFRRM